MPAAVAVFVIEPGVDVGLGDGVGRGAVDAGAGRERAGGQVATGGVPVPENAVSSMAMALTRDVAGVGHMERVGDHRRPRVDRGRVGRLDHRERRGLRWRGTVAVDGGDSAVPPPVAVPVAVAVLVIEPASMSACVTV